MKADAIPTTPDGRERHRMILAKDLASDLTRSAGMVYLAAYGVKADCKVSAPSEWDAEALLFAAQVACDIAERMAALVRNQPCRWNAKQPDEEWDAIDAPEEEQP